MTRDIERVSIELTQRCRKACWFCYSASHPEGATELTPHEVTAFAGDLAANGVRAVSFGGGEPLEYEGLFDVLADLRGVRFRSLTTNGLLLHDPAVVDALVRAAPDKVHVSSGARTPESGSRSRASRMPRSCAPSPIST